MSNNKNSKAILSIYDQYDVSILSWSIIREYRTLKSTLRKVFYKWD